MAAEAPFWRSAPLAELSDAQWEALCDGCALCCLHKRLRPGGGVEYSPVACRWLDRARCRCRVYADRRDRVPDCLVLSSERPQVFAWLPESCAYRRRAEGRDLPDWHYLVCGDPERVHDLGISARGRCLSEDDVHPDDLALLALGPPD